MSPATEGFGTWIVGAGDDLDNPPGRGAGEPFLVDFAGRGTQTKEFRFSEPVEVHDGQIQWSPRENWGALDTFSLGVRCPETQAVENSAGKGNANKVPSGMGFNILVPAAGNGGWDVDLAKAVPVKLKGATNEVNGYWDVFYNTGAVSPSAIPGGARWHLIDEAVGGWMIRNVRMTHEGGWFDIDTYKNEYVHHNWVLVWEVTKATPGAGMATGFIQSFRRHTG
jgi:hypothetical protein